MSTGRALGTLSLYGKFKQSLQSIHLASGSDMARHQQTPLLERSNLNLSLHLLGSLAKRPAHQRTLILRFS